MEQEKLTPNIRSGMVVSGGIILFGSDEPTGSNRLPPKNADGVQPDHGGHGSIPDGGITVPDDGTTTSDGVKPPESGGSSGPASQYPNHVFTSGKSAGSCGSLTGRTLFCFAFAEHPEAKLFWYKKRKVWTETQIQRLDAPCAEVLNHLKAESEKDGVELSCLSCEFTFDAPVPKTFEDTAAWRDLLAKSQGFPDMDAFYPELLKRYEVGQAAFLFLTKCGGRSFARVVKRGGRYCEHAVLYGQSYRKPGTILHELLHLFGAEDLYFHPKVVSAAKRLFPNSVMRIGSGMEIDNLTRFLIGWHKTPKQDAAAFLEETKDITHVEFAEARKKA